MAISDEGLKHSRLLSGFSLELKCALHNARTLGSLIGSELSDPTQAHLFQTLCLQQKGTSRVQDYTLVFRHC